MKKTTLERRPASLRVLLAVGSMVAAAGCISAAALTESAATHVLVDGTHNYLDILVAGNADPSWAPADSDWEQGDLEPVSFQLTGGERGYPIAPGDSAATRLAVKNASPSLEGELFLSIVDPDPLGESTDPLTGRYLELFDQLEFTVSSGGIVLADAVRAAELPSAISVGVLTPGEADVLDVVIHLPEAVDNRWQTAGTKIQFRFEGVSK